MQFTQEFTVSSWGEPMHQLVVEFSNGMVAKSGFVSHKGPAVVDSPVEIGGGWIAFTEYYDGVMPRLSSFSNVMNGFGERQIDSSVAFPESGVEEVDAFEAEDEVKAEDAADDEEANDEEFCFRESSTSADRQAHEAALDRVRAEAARAWREAQVWVKSSGAPYRCPYPYLCPYEETDLRAAWVEGWVNESSGSKPPASQQGADPA